MQFVVEYGQHFNETEVQLMEDIKQSFWNMIPSAKLTGDPSFENKNYSYNKGDTVKHVFLSLLSTGHYIFF